MGSNNLENSKLLYELLGAISNKVGIKPYIPHINTDPKKNSNITSQEVYSLDLHFLSRSDLIISYIGTPSLGVGAELAISVNENKTVIAVYHKNDSVSRFTLGMLEKSKRSIIIEYEDVSDLENKLHFHLTDIYQRRQKAASNIMYDSISTPSS